MVIQLLTVIISIIYAAQSCARTLGLIYNVFECKDFDIVLNLYKSLACPLLESNKLNNAIWGPTYVMDKQKVEAIQQQATRMIPICYDLPYFDCLHYLNLSLLQYQRHRIVPVSNDQQLLRH